VTEAFKEGRRHKIFPKRHVPQAVTTFFFFFFRVQETDGSFFESFTALSWKQENRRLMAMQEVEGRAEDPPPSEQSVGIKPVECRIHKKEVGSSEFSSVSQGEATLM
jgi:hypothetical protein